MNDTGGVAVLDLTGGGSINLVTSGDGGYYLIVSPHEGASFSIALSSLDLLGLRALTGDLVMKAAR